jgi:NitT/TauT family transport system permease protein
VVVWSAWKPDYVLPGPGAAFGALWDLITDGTLAEAAAITMRRALTGFLLAVVIGVIVGSLVSRVRTLRAAFGSMISGLQTMPSIAWFPLALILFQRTEKAILFVVVLGAAPAIANGLIAGVDHIPPTLLRAGRVLGARGLSAYRHVILPAALPEFVSGLKQGWAFAWRSLMAGELLVNIAHRSSLGVLLDANRQFADVPGLMATMIVILLIGIFVDALVFGTLDRAVRRRWGLLEPGP